jgi:hypothetical protein
MKWLQRSTYKFTGRPWRQEGVLPHNYSTAGSLRLTVARPLHYYRQGDGICNEPTFRV